MATNRTEKFDYEKESEMSNMIEIERIINRLIKALHNLGLNDEQITTVIEQITER